MKIEDDLKQTLIDYFELKVQDYIVNEEDLEEWKSYIDSLVTDCIEEVLGEFKYYNAQIDRYLESYEEGRQEQIKEDLKKYGFKDSRH